MKIKLFLLAAAAAMTTLVGCSDKDSGNGPTPGPTLPEGYEITFGTASVSSQELTITPISPEAEESLYLCYVTTEELYKEYGSVEAYAMADMAAWMSEYPDATMEQIVYTMTNNGQNKGTITTTVTGLSANSNYYALVVGIDLEGAFTTQGTAAAFTSASKPDVVEVDCDFTWEGDSSGLDLLGCKGNSYQYNGSLCRFLVDPGGVSYDGRIARGVEEEPGGLYGKPCCQCRLRDDHRSDAVLQNKGEQELQIQGLEPQTSYVLFLCGMDAYARPTTDVEVLNASTIAYVASDAVLTPAARL